MIGINLSFELHDMNDSLDRSFGLVIAFLLPGFISVLGIMALSPTVASWLSSSTALSPTIGNMAVSYVVLCSLGTGLIASAFRWLLIDSLMHRTGLRRPESLISRDCRPTWRHLISPSSITIGIISFTPIPALVSGP